MHELVLFDAALSHFPFPTVLPTSLRIAIIHLDGNKDATGFILLYNKKVVVQIQHIKISWTVCTISNSEGGGKFRKIEAKRRQIGHTDP